MKRSQFFKILAAIPFIGAINFDKEKVVGMDPKNGIKFLHDQGVLKEIEGKYLIDNRQVTSWHSVYGTSIMHIEGDAFYSNNAAISSMGWYGWLDKNDVMGVGLRAVVSDHTIDHRVDVTCEKPYLVLIRQMTETIAFEYGECVTNTMNRIPSKFINGTTKG